MKFEVLTPVIVTISIFCRLIPGSLAFYRNLLPWYSNFSYSVVPKMWRAGSLETSVWTYHTMQCHIQDSSNLIQFHWKQDSSVAILMRLHTSWMAEEMDLHSWQGHKIFLFTAASRLALWLGQPSIPRVLGTPPLIKKAGQKGDQSP